MSAQSRRKKSPPPVPWWQLALAAVLVSEVTFMQISLRDPRPALLQRALKLEYLTVGWNLVEGVVAIAAALSANSVALLGFGIDS
jgi:hypothetical protein